MSSPAICNVVDFLTENYNVDGIVFQEDNFFLKRERIHDVLEHLAEKQTLGWKGNARIDYFSRLVNDVEFMRLLVASGCRVLQFGVEAGTDRVLRFIRKGFTRDVVVETNRKLAAYDIRVRYNLIVGFPSETPEEVEETIKLADLLQKDNSRADPPFVNIYNPYPGTPLFQEAVRLGFVAPRDILGWASFNWQTTSTPWVSEETRQRIEAISQDKFESSPYLTC
jgi:radical SAM superfamily enzyme YgiQ (UPF0313 family)